MKLILFPLLFLVLFAFLSQMDIATPTTWNATSTFGRWDTENYFDANGHIVSLGNDTAAGEPGVLDTYFEGALLWNYYSTDYGWRNSSGTYPAYNTADGVNSEMPSLSFNFGTSIGMIAIIIAVMALGLVAGIRVLGSGVNTFSVSTLVLGTVFLAIWGVFSILSLPLITLIPLLGPFFYMFLTILYTLGCVGHFSGKGDD